jgi:hypothetical protein
MRIEVTVEGIEPFIHRLTKEKTLVGSGTDCDIHVAAEGMSRKHLQIIATGDQFFVVDQGSSNGTFINETRLVPGQRSEFNSFFPIKLGHLVTLALLPDEEGAPKFELSKAVAETPKTAPPMQKAEVPINSFSKKNSASGSVAKPSTTKSGVKGNTVKAEKKAPPISLTDTKEDKQRMRNTKIIAFFVLVGGLIYYYFQKGISVEVVDEAQKVAKPVINKLKLSELKLRDSFPSSPQIIMNYTGSSKCGASEVEMSICRDAALPLDEFSGSGIRRENDVIQIFLPKTTSQKIYDLVSKKIALNEMFRIRLEEFSSPQDMIDFFLGRIDPVAWKTYSTGARWVIVVFIDSGNLPQGNVWFAPLSTLAAVFDSPGFMSRKESYETGVFTTNMFGGFFRVADL